MAAPEPRYKLSIRFDVVKVLIDPDYPERESHTGERISIDTNMDLTTSSALTDVLMLVEQIQAIAQSRMPSTFSPAQASGGG